MKINYKVFVLIILAIACLSVGLVIFQPVERFFLAAVSNANVYVPATQENNSPFVVSGGGSGYYPTIITPVVPPVVPLIVPPAVPPVVPSVVSPQKPSVSLLPLAVANLTQKIPQLGAILSNLNVKTAQDVAGLSNYNIFLPKIDLTALPSDMVFVLFGNGKINALTKLDFSENAPALEQINVLTKIPMRLVIKPSSPAKEILGYVLFKPSGLPAASQDFSVLKFNYNNNGNDGIYVADIFTPSVEGQYQIVTSINYSDEKIGNKDIKITTLVDPDGYIYQKIGDKELRINNAVVSLYRLNDKSKYELWSANEYGQENPQITDVTGNYSFLVPEGTYYLTIKAPGYNSYQSDAISVKEGKEIRSNIELKKEFDLYSLLNWNAIVTIILFLLVFYNFYRDFKRKK